MPCDSRRLALLVGLAMIPAGGNGAEQTPATTVTVERIAYKGWTEAYKLQNGTVEVVVVPAVARILHYGYVGGPNLIWENARVAGQTPTAGQWTNFGGNKVWIWPQDDWPARTGSGWPPPTDLPATIGQSVEILDGSTLRLTSPAIPGFGVRTIREIRLATQGTQVSITSRVERLGSDALFRMAAWTVTQVPADGQVFARLVPGSRLAGGYRLFGPEPFAAVTRVGSDILVIERPTAHSAKLGLDGDLLAWQRGEDLFIERSIDATSSLADFAPGDRAQVYSHPDGDAGLPPGVSYVELELTAPFKTLRAGEQVTLETTWELVKLGAAERSREAIAARLRAQ